MTWDMLAFLALVILIIISQIILMFGNLRKRYAKDYHLVLLWLANSSKTPLTATALRMITLTVSDSCSSSGKNGLEPLLAAIIFYYFCDLNHMTAYSSQDNEIWLLWFGQLLVPLGQGIYILFLSLPGCSHIPLLCILVYMASFSQCYQSVQAQRSASTDHMRELTFRFAEASPREDEVSLKPLSAAHNLIQASRSVFFDLPCQISTFFFSEQHTAAQVFHVSDIALGYAYDLFYTDINRLITSLTFTEQLLDAANVLFFLLILGGFLLTCDMDNFLPFHVAIIHVVFAVEVLKKVYGAITMFLSNWMGLYCIQNKLSRTGLFGFCKFPCIKRWSNDITQLDILQVVTEEKPAWCFALQKYFGIDGYLEKWRYRFYSEVPCFLEDLIHERILYIKRNNFDLKNTYIQKGGFSLKNNSCDSLLWSIDEVEFHESILIWHIAITINYYLNENEADKHRMASKLISNYMLYLLVSTELLPEGYGMIKYKEACSKAKYILNGPVAGKALACQKLLNYWPEPPTPEFFVEHPVHGWIPLNSSYRSLYLGCKLALALQETEDMWKVTSQVSIEILAYAAAKCRGVHHIQQLRRGGELLTHVLLVMVGFGIFNRARSVNELSP